MKLEHSPQIQEEEENHQTLGKGKLPQGVHGPSGIQAAGVGKGSQGQGGEQQAERRKEEKNPLWGAGEQSHVHPEERRVGEAKEQKNLLERCDGVQETNRGTSRRSQLAALVLSTRAAQLRRAANEHWSTVGPDQWRGPRKEHLEAKLAFQEKS